MRIYLSEKQIKLLLEALEMLEIDFSRGGGTHPEVEEIRRLEDKLGDALGRLDK